MCLIHCPLGVRYGLYLKRCNPDGSKCGAACHVGKHTLIRQYCATLRNPVSERMQRSSCWPLKTAPFIYISLSSDNYFILKWVTASSSPWVLIFDVFMSSFLRPGSDSFDQNTSLVLLSGPILSWSTDASACLPHPPVAFSSLFLTAGGHSSNLSLWHAVNLPKRDPHTPVCQETSAKQDVRLNTTYSPVHGLYFPFDSSRVARVYSHVLPICEISCLGVSCQPEAKSAWDQGEVKEQL